MTFFLLAQSRIANSLRLRFRVLPSIWMVLLLLITDGPTSVNYGWSYFHMDSPTDKNPADSGLLRLITDGPTSNG